MKIDTIYQASPEQSNQAADLAPPGTRESNQTCLRTKATLRLHRLWFGLLRCGGGPRLAENPNVTVLLLEAGGTDDVPSVREAGQSLLNLGSERDWGFRAQANPYLNGPLHSYEYGQGTGGRIQHQLDGLGARTQKRLGLLRLGSRRSRVELPISAEHLPSHRRLAWRA